MATGSVQNFYHVGIDIKDHLPKVPLSKTTGRKHQLFKITGQKISYYKN